MNKIITPVLASILILGSIGLSYDVYADDDDEEGDGNKGKQPKTFESECAKKLDKENLNLDGLFCQIIIVIQGLIDSLDARVTLLEDEGVGKPGPQDEKGDKGDTGDAGPAGPAGDSTSLSCENQLAIAAAVTGFTADQTCSFNCGNGIVEPFEQCDDGNITSGDGCSAHCAFEIDYSAESCTPTCQGDVSLCEAGVCVDQCSVGLDQCNDFCTDQNVDSNNCGGCGNVCSVGEACVSGNCQISPP